MEPRYLIDSNIIIDYAANNLPDKANNFVEQLFQNDFLISIVVKIEVLGYNEVPHKLKALERFIASATTIALDDTIANKTIELKRNKKIKLGDAIIAATAITHGYTLVTRNVSDFNNVPSLILFNPWD